MLLVDEYEAKHHDRKTKQYSEKFQAVVDLHKHNRCSPIGTLANKIHICWLVGLYTGCCTDPDDAKHKQTKYESGVFVKYNIPCASDGKFKGLHDALKILIYGQLSGVLPKMIHWEDDDGEHGPGQAAAPDHRP